MENFSSRLLEEAVSEFAALPGVGRKSALRMVLHLLRQDKAGGERFGSAVISLCRNIRYCTDCHNISDRPVCSICEGKGRDRSVICVVENVRDVIAVENTRLYRGLYHVLGGIISPMDGIGPNDLHIESLVQRAGNGETKEIIMALSTTMEGDTTNFYLYRRLKDQPVVVSTIARGVAMGDELEYTDEITLGRSIASRVPYEQSIAKRPG